MTSRSSRQFEVRLNTVGPFDICPLHLREEFVDSSTGHTRLAATYPSHARVALCILLRDLAHPGRVPGRGDLGRVLRLMHETSRPFHHSGLTAGLSSFAQFKGPEDPN